MNRTSGRRHRTRSGTPGRRHWSGRSTIGSHRTGACWSHWSRARTSSWRHGAGRTSIWCQRTAIQTKRRSPRVSGTRATRTVVHRTRLHRMGGEAGARSDTLLRAVKANAQSLWYLSATFPFSRGSYTYPAVIVLMKNSNQLTRSQFDLVIH